MGCECCRKKDLHKPLFRYRLKHWIFWLFIYYLPTLIMSPNHSGVLCPGLQYCAFWFTFWHTYCKWSSEIFVLVNTCLIFLMRQSKMWERSVGSQNLVQDHVPVAPLENGCFNCLCTGGELACTFNSVQKYLLNTLETDGTHLLQWNTLTQCTAYAKKLILLLLCFHVVHMYIRLGPPQRLWIKIWLHTFFKY